MKTSIDVQTMDFDLSEEYQTLRTSAVDAGAIVTFTGLVRELLPSNTNNPDSVESLYLEHYPGMTEKCLQEIVAEANAKWRLLATRVIHRVGELRAQDQIVFVGTASCHRQDAFAAAEFIMDYLKSKAPFWKKQTSQNGSSWIESRESDQAAMKRWQEQ